MCSRHLRIEFQRLLERRNRPTIIAFFEICLAQPGKACCGCRCELGYLPELNNRYIKMASLFGLGASMHMLQHFWRCGLPQEEQAYDGDNHGFSASSTTSRNWSARTLFRV